MNQTPDLVYRKAYFDSGKLNVLRRDAETHTLTMIALIGNEPGVVSYLWWVSTLNPPTSVERKLIERKLRNLNYGVRL